MRILFAIAVMLLFLSQPVLAQHVPPFSYNPDKGTQRWSDPTSNYVNAKNIPMDRLSAIPSSDNGLVVSFNLRLALNEENKPLVSFTDLGEEGEVFMEILYSKRTITINRYKEISGKRIKYSYHLFDPLFKDIGTGSSGIWNFRLYFTSEFMYFVAETLPSTGKDFYMAPMFFGLDDAYRYPQTNSIMGKYLNRSERAVIKLGSQETQYQAYIAQPSVNSFDYSTWWKVMQAEFASPNPPGLPD